MKKSSLFTFELYLAPLRNTASASYKDNGVANKHTLKSLFGENTAVSKQVFEATSDVEVRAKAYKFLLEKNLNITDYVYIMYSNAGRTILQS